MRINCNIKDSFYKYMMAEAVRQGNKNIQENKSKFLLLHSSSGHKGALQEILREPSIQAQMADTKFAQETKALENFFQMLNDDPDRAFYGLKDVTKASDLGAISVLLLSDNLFRYELIVSSVISRSSDVATRKKYIALAEKTKEMGGTVLILSSMHVSGERKCDNHRIFMPRTGAIDGLCGNIELSVSVH